MFTEHELRRQLSSDHRARLADDFRRAGAGRHRRHDLGALVQQLRLGRRRSRPDAVKRVPLAGR